MSRALARVKYGYDDHIEVIGHGTIWVDDLGSLGAPLEIAGPASLTALAHAMARMAEDWSRPELALWLSHDPPDVFDDEESFGTGISVVWAAGALRLDVQALVAEGAELAQLRRLLDRVAAQWNFTIKDIETERLRDGTTVMTAGFEMRLRGQSVGDAHSFGERVQSLVTAASSGELTMDSTLELLHSGAWEALLGQLESDWLDAKRQHYAINTAAGAIALAADIASFANGVGGLVVVGMKTKKTPDGDMIATINSCPLPRGVAKRYRQSIAHRVTPHPVGLEVLAVRRRSGSDGLLVIRVPPQDPHLLPFAVVGMVVGTKLRTTYLGVPVRRQDETSWLSPIELQARLRTGR